MASDRERKRHKAFSSQQYAFLLAQAEAEVKSTNSDLEEARELAKKAGLSIDSDLPALVKQHKDGTAASALTGGHSNTDHIIVLTGDYTTDRVTELRRNLLTRCRAAQPEFRGEVKWDKPRMPGERRRRIVRENDLPAAPPEPPPSGYIVFLGQMTTKIRHDRSHERHNQTRVVQEISKMWRLALSDRDRQYYHDFSEEVRKEYKKQRLEFRATGHYTPSETFERPDGVGLWVRKNVNAKNALELEIANYDSVVFPMRPPEFDEEYRRREIESKERRKERLRAATKGVKRRSRKAPPEPQEHQVGTASGTNSSSDQGEEDQAEETVEQGEQSGND
jgi:HMG (high mobility group) box